jgi:dTDP-4-amino-4,6-dideoxygalactose transaminase
MTPSDDWLNLAHVDVSPEGVEAVAGTLRSGWLSMGRAAQSFEAMLRELTGAPHAVMTGSCTAATEVALRGLGVGPGDEVIVPAFTWPSAVSAACGCGAVPVAADIDPDTLILSPAAVGEQVTARTRAVLVVDYAGAPADIAGLRAVLPRSIPVLEDAAHAFGTVRGTRFAGTEADVGLYSFGATKTFALGEGGAIVCSDPDLAARCRALRNTGVTASSFDKHQRRSSDHDVIGVGLNAKPTETVAALGVAEASRLPAVFGTRTRAWLRLRSALADVVALPAVPAGAVVVPYLFPVITRTPVERDAAYTHLRDHRIEAGKHYPPLHRFAALTDALQVRGALPHTEATSERVLTLPCHQGLGEAGVDRLIAELTDALDAATTGAPALAS